MALVSAVAPSVTDRSWFETEVLSAYRPVVMRGLVSHWPVVDLGRRPRDLAKYLAEDASSQPVELFVGPPEIHGRFFYDPTAKGLNFERRRLPLAAALDHIASLIDVAKPPSIYAGGVPTRDLLRTFARDNRLDLIAEDVQPRLWVGNAVTVSTHYDLSDNIACVVAGRRRFTLFPPEQLANLYVGPLDFTLAGQPVSMVDLKAPDFERFPRFRTALEAAQVFELEPGDALYIPPLWWHHVESLTPFNVLVNYWWNAAGTPQSPFDALIHAVMAVRHLPDPQKAAWRNMFDHYVFDDQADTVTHLREQSRGVLGAMTPGLAQRIRGFLMNGLKRG